MINREINAANRRMIDITLTEKGLEVVRNLSESVRLWQVENNHLTDEEAIILSNLLDKMRG